MEFSLFFVLFIVYFTLYINAEVQSPIALPIRNGNVAHENQFKYQLSLQRKGAHFCGGGIIADQFVLTAAHCVINKQNEFKKEQITVLAGVLDAKNDKGVQAEVEAIYVPKIYDPSKLFVGDIAVLKLKNSLGLDKNENLMRLMRPNKIKLNYPSYTNVRANIAGYGWNTVNVTSSGNRKLNVTGSTDGKLRFAGANIIDNTICNDLHHSKIIKITRENICALVDHAFFNDISGLCTGDSGGPLVVDSNVVVGVANGGVKTCDERTNPGIYTRVSFFEPFINDVLKGTGTSDTMRVATWDKSWTWLPFVYPKYKEITLVS